MNDDPNASEDLTSIDELVTVGDNRKKRKTSRALLWLLGGVILFFALASLWINLTAKKPDPSRASASSVATKAGRITNQGSESDSEVLQRAFRDEDTEKGERARKMGASSVPRLMGRTERPEPQPDPEPEPEMPVAKPEPVQENSQRSTIVTYTPRANPARRELSRWLPDTSFSPGNIVTVMSKRSEPSVVEKVSDAAEEALLPLGATPGTVLYAIVDIGASSDQSGTPVMARVAAGEYTGAKFIGGFRLQGEKLVLQFNRAVFKGRAFSISGYGVSPDDLSPGVASDVDHHYLERWGGLIAASFLEGFGEAKSRSGTTYYYGNDNNPGQFATNYDVNTEAWIAAGKVGERLADKLADNFNREPTVTLEPGTPIGILLL